MTSSSLYSIVLLQWLLVAVGRSLTCAPVMHKSHTFAGLSVANLGHPGVNGALRGNEASSSSEDDCKQACCEIDACTAAVFDYQERRCYLQEYEAALGELVYHDRYITYTGFVTTHERGDSPEYTATVTDKEAQDMSSQEAEADDEEASAHRRALSVGIAPIGNFAGREISTGHKPINSVVITNPGGTGTYDDVTSITEGGVSAALWYKCGQVNNGCQKKPLCVTGGLAPFNEELGVAFRGPLKLSHMAWYYQYGNTFTRKAYWDPTTSDNFMFMVNKGGGPCSGGWGPCHGPSQTYASASGNSCGKSPAQFAGVIGDNVYLNAMATKPCASKTDCGAYRDVGMHGWTGGDGGAKMFVVEVTMPRCGGSLPCASNGDIPAIWLLNAKVFRAVQFGCNCRGAGGQGGCGELDIVEGLPGLGKDGLYTTYYDFKGWAQPRSQYFLRPTTQIAHYAAIFRGGSKPYVQVVQLTNWDYKNTLSVSTATLDSLYNGNTVSVPVIYTGYRSCTNGVDLSGRSAATAPAPAPTPIRLPPTPTTTPTPTPTSATSCTNKVLSRCGGQSYTGQTCCPTGTYCKVANQWWSDCQPKTTPTPSPTPATSCTNKALSRCGGKDFTGIKCCPTGYSCTYANDWWSDCQISSSLSVASANVLADEAAVVITGMNNLVLAEGHRYIGCFKDAMDHDMELLSQLDDGEAEVFTTEQCATQCKNQSFLYFGLQKGKKCFCSNVFGRYGESHDCTTPCSGAPTVACGGPMANSVYKVTQDNVYRHLGCFKDTTAQRALAMASTTLTHTSLEECAALCANVDGAVVFGVQSGTDCYCGSAYGYNQYGPADNCDIPCAHSPQMCGGHEANSVYSLVEVVGCFSDRTEAHDMDSQDVTVYSTLTPEKCAQACSRYHYFGLQNGNECWCGNEYGKYGMSSTCTTPCTGQSDTMCGGLSAHTVYKQLSAVYDATFMGCFADMAVKSDLDVKIFTDSAMTVLMCQSMCKAHGSYSNFGLQAGKDCWCGNAFGSNGTSDRCNFKCAGDKRSICGGWKANSIYQVAL